MQLTHASEIMSVIHQNGGGPTNHLESVTLEKLQGLCVARTCLGLLRRHRPGTDLVSALVAAHDDAESLNAEELLAFVVLLLLAGNETTTNLIGNGMPALGRDHLQNRAAASLARADAGRCPGESALRRPGAGYLSPRA